MTKTEFEEQFYIAFEKMIFNAVKKAIEPIERAVGAKRYTITKSEIAGLLNVSRSYTDSHPWLYPNFGKSDFDGKKCKWYITTWEEWNKRSVEERKKEYEKQSLQEVRRLYKEREKTRAIFEGRR